MSQTLVTNNPFISTAPFQERLNRLWLSLERAILHDRSAILLAVYRSEFIRRDIEIYLTEKIEALDKQVVQVQISETLNDIPVWLRDYAERDDSVFFISGLRWDGEDGRKAYRSLNIRREYFTTYKIKVVFWLTEKEAAELPIYATDFWVFRHQAVDFVDEAQKSHIDKHAYELVWERFNSRSLAENKKAEIALREQLLAELPDQPEVSAIRAQLLYSIAPFYSAQNLYEKANESLEQALDIANLLHDKSLRAMIYNGLGNIKEDIGHYEEAITAFKNAIQLNPNDATPYNNLGNAYYNLGRIEEAIEAFQKAIKLNPNDALPHNGLGTAYTYLGRYEEAIAAFQQAIKLHSDYAHPYNGLGNVFADLGQHEMAISAYNQAIQLNPKDAAPYNNLGTVYADFGRYEEAIDAFQRAIQLDPTYSTAQENLALASKDLKHQKETTATHEKVKPP